MQPLCSDIKGALVKFLSVADMGVVRLTPSSRYSIWNLFGTFVIVNGPFHFANYLFLFSRGRMVITTRSPTEKGFFS